MGVVHTYRTGKPGEHTETKRLTPITAIRAHCVECMGGNLQEPTHCTGWHCSLWPFREGDSHTTRRDLSEQEREVLRDRLKSARSAQRE